MAEALKERTTLILDASEPPWDVFDTAARARIAPGSPSEDINVGAVPDEKINAAATPPKKD